MLLVPAVIRQIFDSHYKQSMAQKSNTFYFFFLKSSINAFRSGVEGSVRLLLTKNFARSSVALGARYTVSHLNGSRGLFQGRDQFYLRVLYYPVLTPCFLQTTPHSKLNCRLLAPWTLASIAVARSHNQRNRKRLNMVCKMLTIFVIVQSFFREGNIIFVSFISCHECIIQKAIFVKNWSYRKVKVVISREKRFLNLLSVI